MSTPDIAVQSVTQTFPASQGGYVLFVPPTGGGTQLLSISDLTAMVKSGGAIYRAAFSWPGGVPGNSQLIGDHAVSVGFTIPPDFGTYAGHASQAGGTVNTTGSTVFTLSSASSGTGSWTAIGTITFASSSITPTFATTGNVAVRVAKGSVLRIVGPGTADATFANPFFTLVGYES